MMPTLFNPKLQVLIFLATITVPSLHAESRCPGNTASVTPRLVQGALIVIPVSINGAGPFDFMVDTGSQVTVLDPRLAADLHLQSRGDAHLISVAQSTKAFTALLDTLEAASHLVRNPWVVIHELGPIQSADPRIRGVLGLNFLSRFNLLIDYRRVSILCASSLSVGTRTEY